jgi:alpha-tubulin suppressor-like RCC1 family protein
MRAPGRDRKVRVGALVLGGVLLAGGLGGAAGARAEAVRLGVAIAEGTGPLPGDLALDLTLRNPTGKPQTLPVEVCGALGWPSFVRLQLVVTGGAGGSSGRAYHFRAGGLADTADLHPHTPLVLQPGQTLRQRVSLREVLSYYAEADPDRRLLGALGNAAGLEISATLLGAAPAPRTSHRFTLPPAPEVRGVCARQLLVGGSQACVLLGEGTPYCWGQSPPGAPAHADPAGPSGDGEVATPQPVGLLRRAGVEAGLGRGSLCVVTAGREVYCAGPGLASGLPVKVAGLSGVSRLLVGSSESCALLGGGDGGRGGRLGCWGGRAAAGAAGAAPGSLFATTVTALDDRGVAELVAAGGHSCARTPDGALLCWGDNALGQLGTGDVVAHRGPVAPRLAGPVDSVAVGSTHTCAVLRDGGVYCFGKSEHGALGRGFGPGLLQSLLPVKVPGLPASARVFAAYETTLVQARDGTIWTFGGNVILPGVPGRPSGAAPSYSPMPLPELGGDVVELAIGFRHSCARRPSGEVLCWGEHTSELGGDPAALRDPKPSRPLRVPGLPADIKHIAAGDSFTCALSGRGTVFCWGQGAAGQLGNGRKDYSPRPVRVALPCRAD